MKKSKAKSALLGVTGNTCLAGELQVSSGQKSCVRFRGSHGVSVVIRLCS